MSRRIVLCPIGTRGDFEPMLALAKGLQSAGWSPVLCAAPRFEAEASGIEFVTLAHDDQAFNAARVQPWQGLRAVFADAVNAQARALLEATRDGAAMILGGSGLHFAGPTIAEARRIPFRLAVLSPPVMPSRELGPPIANWSPATPRAVLRAGWRAMSLAFDHLVRAPLDAQRAHLGLGPVREPILAHLHGRRPLMAVDPELSPIPLGSPVGTVQTHAWRLERPAMPLPQEVLAFLKAGAPPMFVGFGSDVHSTSDPRRVIELVVAAARRVRQRVVIATPIKVVADDVLTVKFVDHAALFPHVSLVVHHGGAGVVQTCARAGVPQLAVPHMTDLFFWGHRIKALGLGPAPVVLSALTESRLVAHLQNTLRTNAYRLQARALAAALNGVNGVSEAVAELTVSMCGSSD